MVLLDWEKAFDKVSHAALFLAMERMNVDQKYIKLVQALYKAPYFKVEIEGHSSKYHRQDTGIRQGCPLSPYLFLIIMTTLFHDVKDKRLLASQLAGDRIIGAMFDEVLYADDTIVFSEDTAILGKLVRKIEKEGDKYGLKLNKTKCELVNLNRKQRIRFQDGTLIPLTKESKYLGCMINDKGDPKREVNKRIGECFSCWKRLEVFWKHSDCTTRQKLIVYDAVIRSRLLYGLESVQINEDLIKKET